MNQHYFDVPFAFSGDKTTIPDPLQSGGTVSFTEGWNYNYQRNLSTDPAALPIDRSTTNYLFYVITQALQALQQTGVPEFITAAQNGGTAFPYAASAVVLYSASGSAPFNKFVSLAANNTNTPSIADPLGTTTGWQIVADPIATSAQAAAGTSGTTIMTPATVAQQDALRALLAGSSSQVFNVAAATATTHAAQAVQVQQGAFNNAGTAGGSANALTASISPAPAAYTDGLSIDLNISANNTGPTTLSLNGLAAKSVVGLAYLNLQGSELVSGGRARFVYSIALDKFILVWTGAGAMQIGTALQSQQAMVLGQFVNGVGLTTPAQHDDTTKGATTQFVWQNRGGWSGGLGVSTNTTLTLANLGSHIVCTSTGTPFAITMPATSLAMATVSTRITNLSGQTVTVNAPSGGSFQGPFNPSGSPTTFTIASGSSVDLLCNNANNFIVTGDGQVGFSSLFAHNFSAPGYSRLPNGLYIAWGSWVASATAGNPVAVAFNTPFPNGILSIATSVNSGSTSIVGSWYDTPTATGFNGHANLASLTCNYTAMGY